MSTLFDDTGGTSRPPPLGLLSDTSGLKHEGGGSHLRGGGGGGSHQQLSETYTQCVNNVNSTGQLAGNVHVMHVQSVSDSNNSDSHQHHQQQQQQQQNSNTNVHANASGSATTLYAVGGAGSTGSQIISSGEGGGLGAVAVDSEHTQGYSYYQNPTSGDASHAGSQFYVMMSPEDAVIAGATGAAGTTSGTTSGATPRLIALRSPNITQLEDGTYALESGENGEVRRGGDMMDSTTHGHPHTRTTRDERRRATHNEVERRRRDKINTWIMKIAAVIPDCQMDQSKQGTSKGGVLSKALDHIIKLRTENDRMHETIKEQERILVENQVLRQQVEKLRQDNAILQTSLQLRNPEQMHSHLEQQQKGGEMQ